MVDLDFLCGDLQDRLTDLIAETKRLREENGILLDENRRLREELTLHQLRSDIETMHDVQEPTEALAAIPHDAVEFYRKLPERLSFADFFRIAEDAHLADDNARKYLTLFLRENLLRQVGRRMQKQQWTSPKQPVTN